MDLQRNLLVRCHLEQVVLISTLVLQATIIVHATCRWNYVVLTRVVGMLLEPPGMVWGVLRCHTLHREHYLRAA